MVLAMVHPIIVAQALGQLGILKVFGIEGLGELIWKRRNIGPGSNC